MKILVTGPAGFLGKKLCLKLLEQGHIVNGYSRGKYPELEKAGVNLFQGDLGSGDNLESAMKDCDAIFHTASKVGMWGDWDDFYRTNVTGTENIIAAAKKSGVEKLVYTSTPSVVYGSHGHEGADESTPYPSEYLSLYAKSKSMAEKKVLDANGPELSTVALRPHLIFGPGDPHIIPRLVKKARKGRLKIVGDGTNKVDVIHVDNVVHAHLLALAKLGEAVIDGKAYFLGQEKPVELWPFINQLLSRFDVSPVTKKVSLSTAYKIGSTMESTFKILGIKKSEPPMTRFVALQLGTSHWFSHENADKELGYRPVVSLDRAIASIGPNTVLL